MLRTHSLVLGLLVVALVRPAVAGEYTVDPDRSLLVVRLEKAGIGAAFAHDHVIRARDPEGAVSWDERRPEATVVEVRADARRLVADEPELRASFGLDTDLADDDRRRIQRAMESESQMAVERYPELGFRSTSVRATGDGGVEVTGELLIHGASRSVTFTTTPAVEGDVLRAEAEIPFLQSEFGIEPYRAALGAVRNRDRATLVVRLLAVATGGT